MDQTSERSLGPLASLVIFNVVLSTASQDALFLAHHGKDRIPIAMLVGALATAGITLGLATLMRRRSPPHTLRAILYGLAGVTTVLAAWNARPTASSTFALFILVDVSTTLAVAATWSYFQAPLDSARIRTLMPRLGTWAGLGGLGAGLLIPVVMRRLGLPQILVGLSAIAWLAAAMLVRSEHAPRQRRARLRAPDSLRLLWQVPLARWMALATGGALWLGLAVQYQNRVALQRTLTSSEIAQVMGLLLSGAQVMGIFVQALVTRRVLERWGVSVALAILPLLVACLLGVYLWLPLLGCIAGTVFVDKMLRPSLQRPAESCLVGALSPEVRPVLLLTLAGVVGPLLKAVGALGLCLLSEVSSVWMVGGGLVIALGLALLSLKWGAIYAQALQRTLEEGSVGAGSGQEALVPFIDGPRLKILLRGIDSGSTHSRELALELLLPHRTGVVREAMRARLRATDENSRICAVRWFAAETSAELESHARLRWEEPDVGDAERIALLEATRDPLALIAPTLPHWVAAPNLELRQAVLRALVTTPDPVQRALALGEVTTLLSSENAEARRAGLTLSAELGAPELVEAVRALVEDPDLAVCREALGCLTRLVGDQARPELWQALGQPFLAAAALRAIASLPANNRIVPEIFATLAAPGAAPHGSFLRLHLLRALGLQPSPQGIAVLLGHLAGQRHAEQLEAIKSLRSIGRLDPGASIDPEQLHAFVLRELRFGLQLLAMRVPLEPLMAPNSLLRRELDAQVGAAQGRISRALALLSPPGTMVRIFKSLKSAASHHRDQARELLRALFPEGALAAGTLKLLDHESPWTKEFYAPPLDVQLPPTTPHAFAWLAATRDPYIVAALRHDPAAPHVANLSAEEDPLETSIDTILFLKDVSLFETLSNQQLVQVARLAEKVDLPAGHTLCREGDAVDYLYLVVRGKLRVTSGGQEVARLGGGECVGEMAVLAETERFATVETVDPCQLMRFDADDFLSLLDTYPEIGRGLLRALVRRLANAGRQSHKPVTQQRAVAALDTMV